MIINDIDFKKAVALIKNSQSIAILGHISPDGDCVGSCMAIYYLLTKLGKKCAVFADGAIKGSIVNIKGISEVLNARPFDDATDLIITADVSSYGRLGANYSLIGKRKIISVDHHETHEMQSPLTFLDPKAPACCEILYDLFCKYDSGLLDDDIAYCLYVGMVTDTGNFSYNNVRPHTFEVAAELLKFSFSASDVSYKMMRETTLSRFKMHSEVKMNAEYCLDGKVAFAHFSQDIFDKYGLDIQETDGVVSTLIEIDTVQIAFVLSDFNNKFKISCRSKLPYSAAAVCERFGGGGHVTAAGCMLQGKDYFEACDKLLSAAKAELNVF